MTPARRLDVCLPLVFLVTLAVFLPALAGQFLDWDDSVNFVANPHYRGLGWTQLRWMFTTTLMGHYIPVTWMSLGLDYVLGGMSPWGYHAGNLLLHSTNAALAYLVARRLLAAARSGSAQSGATEPAIRWAGAFAALAFGVHPLRVESVAWVTERRDVLSGLFFLLTVLTYLKGVEGGELRAPWRYLSLAAFLAAVLSKASAMPLPAVLLLLDIYPLRRQRMGWGRLLVEKLPYGALALATAVVALVALPRGASVTSYAQYGAAARVGMVAYSLMFYPLKFAWPIHLSPMYELPARVNLGAWPFLPALLGVGVVTGVLVLAGRRWPGGLAAWTYSGLMVLPVSGIVHSGSQLVNDRYSYLSGLGFAVLAGSALLWAIRLREKERASVGTTSVVAGGAFLIVAMLGTAAWMQTHVWHDSETLWRWAVEMDPDCSLCQGNLGAAIANSPSAAARLEEAEAHLRRAIELRPDSPTPYFNLGNLFLVRKQYDEAEYAFRRYSALWPFSGKGTGRLGLLFVLRGRYAEAIPLLERARGVRARPGPGPLPGLRTAVDLVEDDPAVLTLLGQWLIEQGQPEEAIGALDRAVALDPGATAAHLALVEAYRQSGRGERAQEELSVLRRLDPAAADRLSRH